MKFRLFKYLIYAFPLLLLAACKKDMTSLNKNPKAFATVPGEMLFSNAQVAFANTMTTPNVNTGIFELISQYWAETTYPQESQYDLGNRSIPLNWWNAMYRDVIQDFNQSIVSMRQQQEDPTLLPAEKLAYKNKIAIAKIFRAYAFSVLVNTYGDIPYTEALQGAANTTPKYDNQKDVYYALLDTISTSIGELDQTGESFGSADLIYSGDVPSWYKLANSMQLKLAMVIADSDPGKAASFVEAAAPNVFQSNDDNALLRYTTTPPNVNPIWTNLVQSGRNDFVAANTIVDTMNARLDPRRPFFFTDSAGSGKFVGGKYGSGNSFRKFSHPSGKVEAADFPAIIMDYAEVELLLAEGAARGMNVRDAKTHYDAGVAASIQFWSDGADDGSAYLANPVNKFDAANWKKSIGVQAWINYYTRGFDAWLEQRRLDYPQLLAPPAALTAFPVRYIYPTTEENLNEANYKTASTSIGGDEVTTHLFWDKY